MKIQKVRRFHQIFLVSVLSVLVACGDDDGDDTNVTINTDDVPQREEGSASAGGTVIINKFDPDIKVVNKNVNVDRDRNFLDVNFNVNRAGPVPHQHVIYPAQSCNVIVNNDSNNDNVIERQEVEQVVGEGAITLNDTQGSDYQFSQSIPLGQLPPDNEQFIIVVYGAELNPTAPVACFPIVIQIDNSTTTGGGGTTTGGGGTTTTGDGGTTTTGGGGTSACLTPMQQQNIRTIFTELSDWSNFSGFLTISQNGGFRGFGSASITQVGPDQWSFSGSFQEAIEPPTSATWRGELRDGCFFSDGQKSNVVSATTNRLSTVTSRTDGASVEESFVTSIPFQFDFNQTVKGTTNRTLRFDLQKN